MPSGERASAEGIVLRPVDDEGLRECDGDTPTLVRARFGGLVAKLGPPSPVANGFGDRMVPCNASCVNCMVHMTVIRMSCHIHTDVFVTRSPLLALRQRHHVLCNIATTQSYCLT